MRKRDWGALGALTERGVAWWRQDVLRSLLCVSNICRVQSLPAWVKEKHHHLLVQGRMK